MFLTKVVLKVKMVGKRQGSLYIWGERSSKEPLPVNKFMEEFLRDGIIASNQRKRACKFHLVTPLIQNRTVTLYVCKIFIGFFVIVIF